MSREVRRVPLDWRHPVEPNPHWRFQQAGRWRRGDLEPTLHGPEEMFTPLLGHSYAEDAEEWDADAALWSRGEHPHQRDYPFEEWDGLRPVAADYMPDFGDADLGWCLYETVSEGTPVTPVFATAEELIGHLCTVGQDWDHVPMRRASAEAVVRTGHTLGSMAVVDGRVLRSDLDADVLMGSSDD